MVTINHVVGGTVSSERYEEVLARTYKEEM